MNDVQLRTHQNVWYVYDNILYNIIVCVPSRRGSVDRRKPYYDFLPIRRRRRAVLKEKINNNNAAQQI